MAADLGLVVDPAEGEAHELAPEGAGDRLADRGLAGARGPDQGQDRAVGAAVVLDAALLAQLAHRDELGDPPLHVLEAGVVLVEDLAGVLRVEPLLGALRPRHREQPVEVAADHRGLGRLLALALEPPQLALGLLGDRLGHLRPRRSSARTRRSGRSSSSPSSLRIDSICLRRKYSRCCFWAPDSTSSRILRRTCSSARRSRCISTASSRRALTSTRLEQLELLLAREVGAEAGGVGQRARLLDGAQEGADALVGAAQLEDLLDHGAVLLHQLGGVLVLGMAVVDLLHVDAQLDRRRGSAAPARPRCRPTTVATWAPPRQLAALDHLGDDADPAELAVLARQQEDAILVAGVDRQGRRDDGEDDRFVKWNQKIGSWQVQFL